MGNDDLLKDLKLQDFIKSISSNFDILVKFISAALNVSESDVKKNIVLDRFDIEKPYDLVVKFKDNYVLIKTSRFNKFIKSIPEYGRFYSKKFIEDEQAYIIYINLESVHSYFYDSMLEQEFQRISNIINIDINDKETLKDYSILASCLRLLSKEDLDEIKSKNLKNIMININYV